MAKIQHLVLLKFKEGTPESTISECFTALGTLPGLISGIEHFSGGPYSSPEGINKGFTHGFLMTFANAEARNGYLPHPEHEKVKALLLQHLDDVVAFDYEMKE